ncbi:conserved hypothetical protein [Frankia canadensis]|uniref:Uncharacterized protein n=1 Tax=Frankia canadensis TaxID=1836972 RepID=A0A2I2KMT1_9ACTN|nr:hypothetical protein [Frankia canadensis]SNQ46952.1 conserved hypothetical protein [Frankia canadensis]SOU54242.1 conserved hypothetical protein [Frankia canadensis]
MAMRGRGGDDLWPASGSLLRTLVSGLDQAERDETLRLLHRRLIEDRAAAGGGQRERQVDVGPRSRAARGPVKGRPGR